MMTRMARSRKVAEAPPTDYEKIRAKNMMRNNRIFQSFGITALASMVRNSNPMQQDSAITCEDSASAITQECSSSDYSPKDDEAIEEDEIDDTLVEEDKALKVSKKIKRSVKKKTKKSFEKPSEMAPGKKRVMAPSPGGSKRVLAGLDGVEPARVTRQKTKLSLTSLEESTLQMDGGSTLHMDEGSTLHVDECSPLQMDERSPLHIDERSLLHMDERIRVAPTPRTNQPLEVPEFSEQPDQEQQMDDEATTTVERCRKGKGLEKITRELTAKIPIQVAEGKRRPEKPVQAAKLASECGLAARHHVPVLPHFKEYKDKKNVGHIRNYIGKVVINFEMDTSSEAIQYACTDILQSVMKNRRYAIKKKYFDNVPANQVSIKSPVQNMTDAEWERLVKMWSSPRHKETCEKNKLNRANVQFHQRTGSRHYIAHLNAIKEARKGEELTAIDLFKECHNSKKIGFSEPVKQAIAEMESSMHQQVREGGESKSVVAVVAEVLTKHRPASTFLRNVGLDSGSKNKFNRTSAAVDAQVQELEYKLEKERQGAEMMREELAALKKKSDEAEAARAIEYQLLLKRAEDTDAKFARLMEHLGKV